MNNQQQPAAFDFAATFETMLEHIDQLEADRPPASFLEKINKYSELTNQEPEYIYKALESNLILWIKGISELFYLE